MRFLQTNDLPRNTFPDSILSNVLSSTAGAIALAAAPILVGGCRTMESNSLQTKATRMLAELDTIASATKVIVLLEIDKAGKCAFYQRLRFQNGHDEAFDSFPLVGGFEDLHLYAFGGEEAEIEFGDLLPNGIEREYTVILQQPVPAGGWLDYVMVAGEVTKYEANEFEDGLWRFGPAEGHGGSEIDWVFAVRLPPGARIASVDPEPDEIREGQTDTLIWWSSPSGPKEIGVSVEYRLKETK